MRIVLMMLLMLNLATAKKVALVIGNKNYTNQTGLKNPISDAKLIGDTLKGMDFEVMEIYNKDLNDLSDKLDDFINKAKSAKVAVIYYAGHGIGVGRNNYLIPIGASNLSVDNLGRKLMSLNELKGAVAKANEFGVVFFDACRNSFFSGQIQGLGSARGSRALVQPTVRRGQNILVSFSTKAGKIAKDDVNNGNHSPYALALSENLNRRKDIRLVMGNVRAKVKELTSFEQIPVDENQLDGEEYCLSEGKNQEITSSSKPIENSNKILKKSLYPGSAFPHNYKFYNHNSCTVYIDTVTKSWYATGGVLDSITLGEGRIFKDDSGSITYKVEGKKINPNEKIEGQLFYIKTKVGVGPGEIRTSVSFTVSGECKTTLASSGISYISAP